MANSLKILHCLRAPVGGLFRHVADLARMQSALGHQVGIIADAATGGSAADAVFLDLAPVLALGVTRVRMPRQIGLADYPALAATQALAKRLAVDVLHGHGAKGGAYARLAAQWLKRRGQPIRAFYTPHGGSLHFEPGTMQGVLFLGLERQLARLTDGLVFESAYAQRVYAGKVGAPGCAVRVIPNGLLPNDFSVHSPNSNAADVLFVGELRHLKGVDVLLKALAAVKGLRPPTAVIVGTGPDEERFKALVDALGLGARVQFAGAMPASVAFRLGRCLIVPSRGESFPYIVLEGAAARLPMLLTRVGGIPEIVGETATNLLPPGDAVALASALSSFLSDPEPLLAKAAELQTRVADRFTVARMGRDILAFYTTAERRPEQAVETAKILPTG